MGIHALVRNKKKSLKDRSLNKWHRAKKAEKKKTKPPPSLIIEDAHLFSTEKMKNKLRNPRNNIAISGKKRQRLMKRLRHSLREKSLTDVEPRPAASQDGDDDPTDEVMQETAAEDGAEQTTAAESTAATMESSSSSSSSSSKKKKRKRKRGKGKASATETEDVDMEED